MTEDPRVTAARYRQEKLEPPVTGEGPADAAAESPPPARQSEADRAAYVETAIQQAIRRGDFDDLPGAGKPIPGLGATHDPDWWIRRKIEREQLSGLGPPALTLRTESAGLAERLDALAREADVREALEDFNRRVVEARRQLLGGPPVVTATRDVEAEVAAWHRRAEERKRAHDVTDAAPDQRPWWRRRR
ncbi:DUF1992 domain-containing protein [Microbacterium sp. CFBP9034]|uniref:DnaJ family domain-containing protein n=1 Tax=Microbacterium sp. CFBP9034 TaxID=3096540 RepID=UPI002A6A98B5|nr:DUF1992 domain-containing protein [Microbacterium sp. CFBP9034]MDY0908605.1 DUF1992 domain-containing protein [Microbacterium sp. CFBP9034]